MTRRRLLLALGIALTVLVAAGAVWWFLSPRPGVTEANCARVRPGMRLDEVEAIFGGPPRVYGPVVSSVTFGPDGVVPPPPGTPYEGV